MTDGPVPVKCPECQQLSLIIKPGDKMYCLECTFGRRFPSDYWSEEFDCFIPNRDSAKCFRYYIRQLEAEVRRTRHYE